MMKTLNLAVLSLLTLMLAGCIGPPALHESVLGYDQTTAELEQEILLLNIACLNHQTPVDFTVTNISNVGIPITIAK
jgi:PBP1b-binding outer membrane lipoprotein LpoB